LYQGQGKLITTTAPQDQYRQGDEEGERGDKAIPKK
jgi:hypothetical protein